MFQKQPYELSAGPGPACALVAYPVALPLATYKDAAGLEAEAVVRAAQTWPRNEFDIPLPAKRELYADQLLAPMFVFQVFCMLLFCLDDYWFMSLFTLAMLVFIESTVVSQVARRLFFPILCCRSCVYVCVCVCACCFWVGCTGH